MKDLKEGDKHKIRNMKGNFYRRETLSDQLNDRHEVINDLLHYSNMISSFKQRWILFEYQVCNFKLYKKKRDCKLNSV